MRRLSDILASAVDQKEILRGARAQTAMRDWESVVGPMLAKKTVPDRYERGTLWVCAENSTWAQELRMHEETVVERLNEAAGEPGLFRDMRVGIRPRLRDFLG